MRLRRLPETREGYFTSTKMCIRDRAWIGLFVNIIICFVARNLLLDEGQLNFHSRADGVWSWLVRALFIAVVVQAISIMLSGRYPYLAIVLALSLIHI